MTEHENWMRYWAVNESRQINRFATVERIIEDAKKLERYMLNRAPADVVPLAVVKKEGE